MTETPEERLAWFQKNHRRLQAQARRDAERLLWGEDEDVDTCNE